MKRGIVVLPFVVFTCISMTSAVAFSNDVKGKHNGKVSCADCHGTAAPEKAAPKSACLKCHENIPMKELHVSHEGRDITIVPHRGPHDAGQTLRCALCHKVHAPSTLSCNKCHHFKVAVP
ncbi:cytochrome c3 family protein [Geobacter sp. FeAm09]|uniref:cytochrome c3 family protein n=1 Tax=Geobacter sp. FeAm09 TaxID=2597769 RepID=UPI0011F0939E|nr:cytochrome c3 family protein [Geobacter sp. FeAm09]QEM69061.1 cytochrome c3 family protein [Geobacter sp. FeAm09]